MLEVMEKNKGESTGRKKNKKDKKDKKIQKKRHARKFND